MSIGNDISFDMELESALGDRTKLKNVPRIKDIVLSKLEEYVQRRIVAPIQFRFPLPSIRAFYQTSSNR